MRVTGIAWEEIDLADERFRISEELDPPLLEESLRCVGQIVPIVLWRGGSGRLIVGAGLRRARALSRLGARQVWARVLDVAGVPEAGVFRLALWDNLAHRRLDVLECARALATLRKLCGVADDVLVAEYLPALGLEAHKNVLRTYLALDAAGPAVARLVRAGGVTAATAARIAGLPGRRRDDATEVFERVRASASTQRELLDHIEELAGDARVRDLDGVAEILDVGNASPGERAEKLRAVLRRLRYPRLAGAEARFAEERSKLELPRAVRVSHAPYFETAGLKVEFEAATPDAFRRAAEALERAAADPRLHRLFEAS
jgi:hypothetical protein